MEGGGWVTVVTAVRSNTGPYISHSVDWCNGRQVIYVIVSKNIWVVVILKEIKRVRSVTYLITLV